MAQLPILSAAGGKMKFSLKRVGDVMKQQAVPGLGALGLGAAIPNLYAYVKTTTYSTWIDSWWKKALGALVIGLAGTAIFEALKQPRLASGMLGAGFAVAGFIAATDSSGVTAAAGAVAKPPLAFTAAPLTLSGTHARRAMPLPQRLPQLTPSMQDPSVRLGATRASVPDNQTLRAMGRAAQRARLGAAGIA